MMLLNNVILVVGVAMMILARYVGQIALIIAGRFVMGVHSG